MRTKLFDFDTDPNAEVLNISEYFIQIDVKQKQMTRRHKGYDYYTNCKSFLKNKSYLVTPTIQNLFTKGIRRKGCLIVERIKNKLLCLRLFKNV